MVNPDHNTSSGSDAEATLGPLNETTTTTNVKECRLPEIKSNDREDYETWRKNVRWWSKLTRLSPSQQAPHVILNSLQTKVMQKVACELSQEEAEMG